MNISGKRNGSASGYTLSVVVPVYNGADTIKACIECILKQTYSELEVIIIDDGSRDSTFEICSALVKEDERVVLLRQENKGVSAARNKGIDYATGKYIMFIDGDDEIEERYFESYMTHHNLIDDGIVVLGRILTYHDDGKDKVIEGKNLQTDIILSKNSLVDIWDSHIWNPPFNKMYDLNVIRTHNIRFDTAYKIGEDWLFNNAYARALNPKGYYIISGAFYKYFLKSDPWRHCKKEEFYQINKRQVEDFKRTINELNVSDEETWKFDKRDIDFTISEIRRIVRSREKIEKAKKLLNEQKIPKRISEHKEEFSKMDLLEFSAGSIVFIYLWENSRMVLGKVKKRYT